MKQIAWRLLAIVALVLLASCGSGGGGAGGTADDVVVADEVRVLDAAAREALDAFSLDLDSGAGEIRFAADSAFAAAVETGAILVTEPVAGVAPHGFLQRVQAKRAEGDEIVLATTQATLEETFERAEIDFEQELVPAELVGSDLRFEGMSLRTASDLSPQASTGFDFDLQFDEVLIDNGNGSLAVNGALHFDARASAKIDIDWFTLEHFSAKVGVQESVDLEFTGTYEGGIDELIEVATLDFGTFTIWVGPVPVVFVLDMIISVGADGTIEAELVAWAEQSSDLTVGAKYTDSGGWQDISAWNSSFDWDASVSATAQASAFVRPQVNLEIYGLAGPFAYADAYVRADAELYRSPLWRLSAGLDFGVGFRVELPVVGEVARWSPDPWNVLHEELGEADNTIPRFEVVNMAADELVTRAEGERLSLQVRADDREQRDVLVELLDASGDVLRSATSEEGGIAYLATPRLCVGLQSFSLRVRDDDGGVVTSAPLRVDVVNPEPSVTIDVEQVAAMRAYAGKFYTAHAEVVERSCEEVGNVADPSTIQWFVDGEPAGSTATLQHRLADDLTDSFVLRAAWSDGSETGDDEVVVQLSELGEGEMLLPVAHIRYPEDGATFEWIGTCDPRDPSPLPLRVEGVGSDADDGLLEGADLQWTLRFGSSGGTLAADGTDAQFDWCDAAGAGVGFGEWTLTLTATDDDDNEVVHEITLHTQPAG